ncbi:butyrophilin subfamily 3 member A2-like [Anarhichas minor]|uniref:butyrophilin subfamily 3 member A2-like n=1 Tax=Anarhichas minor TaxID=65739 RepID=UPI003F732482
MFHLKDEQSPKRRPFTFSVLVFHPTVVLLLLINCCKGQLQVIGPRLPIVAIAGGDIILPCHIKPAVDAASTAVEWTRPDLKPRFVHKWRSGQELLDDQHPLYKGRTSLFIDKLKFGDISLKLSRVKLSDKGTYRCFVPTLNIDSTVELVFGSVSSPDIMISKVSNGVLLECKSKGRYLMPEMLWLDSEGNLLSAGPTETVRGPDHLSTVSSRVTVEKRHSNSFTCRVQQRTINQTRETHICLSADLFMVQCSSAIRISICLAVCIVSVGAAVLLVWKWGQNKTKTTNSSTELQLLMERGDGEKLMTKSEKITYLDKRKEKLDEDLQNNEGELQHVQQVITTLMNQKKDLKNQREKLTSQQQQTKIQLEQCKKKKDPKTYKENKTKRREENLQNLEKREKELEEMLKNTENLLESTEEMINKMRERKCKLERDKEKINKLLKETERQREEIQIKQSQQQH